MSITIVRTNMFGDNYELRADWAQASCPVQGDNHGRQVADFRHNSRAAMESLLRETVEMCGDDADDCADEIKTALDEMVEIDADVDAMATMLRGRGSRFTGNNVDDEAQDWVDNGFDADSADDWCEIGCWNAETAAELRDAGLSPRDAAKASKQLLIEEEAAWDAMDEMADGGDELCDRDSVYTDGDPIYSACNGDTDVSLLIKAASANQLIGR